MIEKLSDTLYLADKAGLAAARAADVTLWMILEVSQDKPPVGIAFYEDEDEAVEALEVMVMQKEAQ